MARIRRRQAVQVQPPQTPPASITPVAPRQGIDVQVNGEHYRHVGDPAMPLLWYLRDVLRLTGTKYACDDGSCGACTVIVDGKAQRACKLPMSKLALAQITTIEGVAGDDGALHPLQKAFVDHDAIGCGYCQPGHVMAALALLQTKPKIGDADIDRLDNLCRCGLYPRIRAAIKQAAADMHGSKA
jgi:isoquinoline 1-oxidoreductase alpha subunit